MQQTIKGLFLNDCHRIAVWDLYQTFENFSAMLFESVAAADSRMCTNQDRFQGDAWRIAAILSVFPSLNPDPTVKMKMEFEDKWQLYTNYKQLSIVSGCNLKGRH